MTPARDIALRLRLPCPECGEVFSTAACRVGSDVALSCLSCGQIRVEPTAIDDAFLGRAAEFCAAVDAPAATPEPLATGLPALKRLSGQVVPGRDN